jgi:uncharacterized protein YecT (DUF1311 family)
VYMTIIVAAVLFGAATPVIASARGEPEQNCEGGAPEMAECLNAKTAKWDRRLTIAYQ